MRTSRKFRTRLQSRTDRYLRTIARLRSRGDGLWVGLGLVVPFNVYGRRHLSSNSNVGGGLTFHLLTHRQRERSKPRTSQRRGGETVTSRRDKVGTDRPLRRSSVLPAEGTTSVRDDPSWPVRRRVGVTDTEGQEASRVLTREHGRLGERQANSAKLPPNLREAPRVSPPRAKVIRGAMEPALRRDPVGGSRWSDIRRTPPDGLDSQPSSRPLAQSLRTVRSPPLREVRTLRPKNGVGSRSRGPKLSQLRATHPSRSDRRSVRGDVTDRRDDRDVEAADGTERSIPTDSYGLPGRPTDQPSLVTLSSPPSVPATVEDLRATSSELSGDGPETVRPSPPSTPSGVEETPSDSAIPATAIDSTSSMAHLVDRVYDEIEHRMRIERERRGL